MIYDFDTKNKSFVDCYRTLLERGVNNNKFMLQLNNPTLVGVDPLKPVIKELEYLILEECASNFWYFVREVLKWPMDDGSTVSTKLDLGNAAMYYNTLNGISTWRTNIRQTCSDLSVSSILLWFLLFKSQNVSNIISKDGATGKYKLQEILNLLKYTPSFIQYVVESHNNDSGRHFIQFIKNKLNRSAVKYIPTPRNREDANNILRGNIADMTFFHMAEFVPELEAILNCRLPVLGEEGKNRINIFNSTFGPADKTSTIFAERYIEGMLKWDDRFYDYDIYELKAAIKRFANGVMYIRHDYTELGYDQEWYDNTTKNMSNKNTKREILLIRA